MAAALLSAGLVARPTALPVQLQLQRALQVAQRARPAVSVVCAARSGPEATIWLPGADTPSYLNGELPGDFGFDPLGLGADPERRKWYVEAEKTNARWAMAGVAGILGQELLGVQPKWFEAGAKDYGWSPLALITLEFLLLGFLEVKRYQGFKKTGQSGFLDSFPFDPAGLYSSTNQTKELKNGRLAMIAFVGFAVQALVTREGPIEGLFAHISDPLGHNILSNTLNLPSVIGSVKSAVSP